MWNFFSALPDPAKVFNSSNALEVRNLQATTFTPPRGTPRIRLIGSTKKAYVIDCLTHAQLCDNVKMKSDILLKGQLLKLKGDFYWPIDAAFTSGRVLTKSESMMLYELFRERDGEFYRFWIALSAAFLTFSLWFGRRPLF